MMLDTGASDDHVQIAAVKRRLCNMAGNAPGLPAETAITEQVHASAKMTRARLTLDVSTALGVDGVPLATAVEALHLASLIHDDVCDAARFRRGRQSVWALHGTGTAIASGDLLIARAFGELADGTEVTAASLRLAEQAVSLTVRGQMADLAAHGSKPLCVAKYLGMASRKCGPLLGLGPGIALICAGRGAHVTRTMRVARWLSVAYQIADDLTDRTEDEANGAPNIVAIVGRNHAIHLSSRALHKADRIAATLPPGVSDAFAQVCAKTERMLPGTHHAV